MPTQSDSLDLFVEKTADKPLAARLRPTTLAYYVGQQHLVAPGRVLYQCATQGNLHSMILWGPPGTGKTTLAHILANSVGAAVEEVSAVMSGVKDIRAALERAMLRQQQGGRTVMFVDEVHRFSKSQQDAFLPHVESGLITFIGATTENPSFEVNSALLSRARVHVLKALTVEDLQVLLQQAMTEVEVTFSEAQQRILCDAAQGDARRLLNWVETLADMTDDQQVSIDVLKGVLGKAMMHYDKGGDAFYDQISAFHKSVRGSSTDGALYWFARMIEAGCDPLYIARRLLAIATEDIGLADPRAMQVTLNAWDIFQRVGEAEGVRAIAEAAVYCAAAPKSNAVYLALKQATQAAQATSNSPVPEHLRNAPTRLMKDLGYGAEYRYAHDEPDAYAAGQTYLPEGVDGDFYRPTERGLEQQIQAKLAVLREKDGGE